MNGTEYNEKVQRGLRAQYSADRVNAVLTQAESMYQHSQWQSGNRTSNKPEPYELLESGWVDRATEFLGFGRWAIGRPRLNGSNGNGGRGFRPQLRATPTNANTQPQPIENGNGWAHAIEDLLPSGALPKSRNYSDNAIVHRKVLVVGSMGKGKSTLIRALALETKNQYSSFQGFIERASLYGTLHDGVESIAECWFFGVDDLTLARIDPIDVNNYYQIRHLIARKTGLRNGLVVTAMGVHRFHGLDVNLGSEFDQLWVKSLPDRPHDRAVILSYFDHVPVYKRRNGGSCVCKACEFERMGEPNNKALVRLSTGESHIVDVPYPQRNVLTDLSKPRISGWYVWLNATIGTGLLVAVGLVLWTLVRVWMRFA